MKILEVNNIDLIGNRFNGYDMMKEIANDEIEIKQAVITKLSNNNNVIELLDTPGKQTIYDRIERIERELSIKNVFSITSQLLRNLKEYQEADIIHFHMFHNSNLSLYSLVKIAEEKKVILSLHDPWFLTGRCVHFFDCDKWKEGCTKCDDLSTSFPFTKDNCHEMWRLKKKVFEKINVDLVTAAPWTYDLIKQSPILQRQKNVHLIPFGIDYQKFSKVKPEEARKKYHIPKDHVVLFLRAQNEFKGTPYIVEALKDLKTNKKITVLTCDNKGLLEEIKNKYRVIDLGPIKDKEMINAMNACDIFLMPSIGESFGMMAIEAMACKKPVVVFNNSALPSVTHAPECGYLVKNRDSDDLRKAIKYLAEHPEDREKRGTLGYKIVKEEYAIDVYNQRIKDLYEQVYNRKKKPVREKKIKMTKNAESFKYYLNDFTTRVFGPKHPCTKELWYDTTNIKRGKEKEFEYSDLALQEVLDEYCYKLTKCVEENPNISNNMINKIQKMVYFSTHNPKKMMDMIFKK